MKKFRHKILGEGRDIKQALAQTYLEDDKFWHDLDNESDRGVTLGAGAYFDTVLERCLEIYFCECDAAKELLSPQGGLGTFAARAKCVRALRIINQVELDQLLMMAKVRNEFAHNLMASFDDERLVSLVERFWKSFGEEAAGNEGTRLRFTVSCLLLALGLQRREIDVAQHVSKFSDEMPKSITEEARKQARPAKATP